MINITASTQNLWWITYNSDKSIIHYGGASAGTSVSSGQPFNDPFYYSEEDWLARLAELGINPFEENNEEDE